MVDYESAKREILDWLAEVVERPVEEIDTNKPLSEVGLDSLDAVHLIATIESCIRRELPENVMQQVNNLNDIFAMMERKVAAA